MNNKVYDIYIKLMDIDDNSAHLLLSSLFSLVFNRKLKRTEWGSLRKLVRIYGREIVYWAILNSARISAGDNVFGYIGKVCTGLLKEETKHSNIQNNLLDIRTRGLIAEFREYKQPDWTAFMEAVYAN